MELRFTVWQFVRVMVNVEESPDPHGIGRAWGETWAALDQELTNLADQDFDAYSDMMMNQDLVIDDATPALAHAVCGVLDAVMGELDAAIKAQSESEDELAQNLKFERRELRQLSRKIARQIQAEEAQTEKART